MAGSAAAASKLPGEGRHCSARRQELIDAAITSIAEHGLPRTTVARVAEAAGLSQGILSFYFDGKQALLLATLEYVESEFERVRRTAMARARTAPEWQLDAIIESTFDPTICNPRYTAVWNAFWGEARARADYMRVCSAHETAQIEETIALFREIADPNVDAEALGTAFFHLLEAIPEPFDEVGHFDLERAKRISRAFLASVFPRRFPLTPDKATQASSGEQ